MPFWTVILENTTGTAIPLEDFGVIIAGGATYTISDYFDYSDIADSKELDGYVSGGSIVVNNGSVDLSAADGLNYIKRDNVYNDLQTHFTKTELSTSGGGSAVHWDNITNAPSFGSPTWINPVLYRVVQISGSEPVGPDIGDVYVDTDDQNYYKWDGSVWNSVGSALAADRVIDLSVNPQVVTVFDGTSTWTPSPEEVDNSAVMVNDDGDNKNAQYIYSEETGVWIKIADVDFEDHLNGGPNKHDASEIDVEGTTYVNLPSAPSDLETVLGDIDTQLTEALDNNTLDGAYDEGGAGLGRVVITDTGSVKLDATSGTNAPFELVPTPTLPSTLLADGQLTVADGILFVYDATRTRWLSVQRQYLVFGRKGTTKNQYLNFAAGTLASNNSGYRLIRNATIVGISGQLDITAVGTASLSVRKGDAASSIVSLSLDNALGAQTVLTTGAVDVAAGEWLQGYADAQNTIQDPMLIVEIAYRL